MEDLVKTCAMCRKEVNVGAILCPYCNSSTDYHYFTAVTEDKLVRIDNKTKFFIQVAVEVVVVSGGFALGFLLGGLWIGLGVSIVLYKVCTAIQGDSPSDNYHHHFICPGCSKEEEISWGSKTFEASKSGFMECSGCRKKTMVARI